ncbi:MAG: DUF763 domain-containing protein, partial [Myxococcota bacterium]
LQLVMPAHHDVRPKDISKRRLYGTLMAAAQAQPAKFDELLLVPGVGPRTVASLAMVSEVVHGAPSCFGDPARFSLAHGGKDGHPYPVPLAVYDTTIRVMRSAVERAKLGNDDKLAAIRALDTQARALETTATEGDIATVDIARIIQEERDLSYKYGGRSTKGPVRPPPRRNKPRNHRQLTMPGFD